MITYWFLGLICLWTCWGDMRHARAQFKFPEHRASQWQCFWAKGSGPGTPTTTRGSRNSSAEAQRKLMKEERKNRNSMSTRKFAPLETEIWNLIGWQSQRGWLCWIETYWFKKKQRGWLCWLETYKKKSTLGNGDRKQKRFAELTRLAVFARNLQEEKCTLGHGDQKQKRFAELTRLAVSKPTS